ncbi:MAG: hypothetical protein P4L43_15080 [Syntrophobacteraceae bacterium]|nr:hypothetical protein [Syntrophobacteraceae bacterium]
MGVIVPIGLGALAAVTLLEYGVQIGAAPWCFLACLAVDAYKRL